MTDRVAFEDLLLNDDGTLNKRARVQNAGWTDEEVAAYRAEHPTIAANAVIPEVAPGGIEFVEANIEPGETVDGPFPVSPAPTTTTHEWPVVDLSPAPLPGYKEIGEGIVDHLLKTYPTAGPLDWRRMQSGMQYANRLGGTWSKKTRG